MKVNHDFHIHTDLSVCASQTAKLSEYVEISKKLGIEKIGIANHFWDSKIQPALEFYESQNFEHISKIKPEIENLSSENIKIYFGAEAEYDLNHRDVSVTAEIAEQLDFLLIPNSHTHMTMPKDFYIPYQKHVDFMIQAYEDIINSKVSKYITAIAHPFEAVACKYDNEILINMISDDTFKRLFDKTAEKEIAYEINTGSLCMKTPSQIENSAKVRLLRLAKESGCKFIFGSDAHNHSRFYFHKGVAQFVADILDLKEDDFVDIVKDL